MQYEYNGRTYVYLSPTLMLLKNIPLGQRLYFFNDSGKTVSATVAKRLAVPGSTAELDKVIVRCSTKKLVELSPECVVGRGIWVLKGDKKRQKRRRRKKDASQDTPPVDQQNK